MWELQPQVCLSEIISPPVLSIPQGSMIRGQGYLGVAAARGQFGSGLGRHHCGFIAAGASLWVGCRELVTVWLLWICRYGSVVVDWSLCLGRRRSIDVIWLPVVRYGLVAVGRSLSVSRCGFVAVGWSL